MFLKPDTVGIIPRGVPNGRSPVCWSSSMAGVHWSNQGQHHSCRQWEGGTSGWCTKCESWWVLSGDEWGFRVSRVFWHACPSCMPNRPTPIETLQGRYEETMARLQKIKDAGYKIVTNWGASLEYCYSKIQALKKNLARTPMCRIHLLIFEMPCTAVELKPLKHTTELSRGNKSGMWMSSVCTPTFVNMESFH